MNKFEEKNNLEREKFVIEYSKRLKLNPEIKKEQILFINNQIENSRRFYDRLLKTENGVEKIVKIFDIKNPKIIDRLKKESLKSSLKSNKLLKRENEEFIRI